MLDDREQGEVTTANESGRQPVLFVHGLWLLAESWSEWRALFETRGYATVAGSWPDDPADTAAARVRPEAFAGKSIAQVTNHYREITSALGRKPIVIGHSFGGLITQKLAGAGVALASVAIDPAPFRGVLPLPLSALKASSPVLRNPANKKRAVALTYDQFRYAFANAVPEDEAHRLYDRYSVAGPGRPLFQAAFANLNPRTEASVDTKRADRGPLLIISGAKDHTVPWAIANASYKRYKHSTATTEIVEIPERGHSLTIDSGWKDVAETALAFLERVGVAP